MSPADIGVRTHRLTVDGTRYVATVGTGERSMGRDGGEACFLYDATDVEELSDVDSYQAFCDALTPEEDRRLAIACAVRELRMLTYGGCDPVLSDDEYAIVRAAVELASEVAS